MALRSIVRLGIITKVKALSRVKRIYLKVGKVGEETERERDRERREREREREERERERGGGGGGEANRKVDRD